MKKFYELGKKSLFPICRSITGNGVRVTLQIIKEHLTELQILSVPSGAKAFDWDVPLEWNIRSARLTDSKGNVIVDFKQSNLHVVSYSEPVDKYLSLEELDKLLA